MMDQMKSAIEAAERVRRERRAGSLVGDEKEQLQQFQARERERQRREEEQRKQQLQQQQQHLPSSQSQQALQPPQQPVKHPEISNVVPPHRAESVPASLVGGKKPAAAAPAPNIPVATKHTKPESSPAGPSASVKMKVSGPVADKKPRGDSMHVGSGPKGIGLDDFTFLAVLGKGNFGKVMLAEEKFSKSLYAIKVLKKEFIIENDEVESTKSEKRVFITATRERHPFLVNLHSCFQTESRIYFVMEYVSGGDLMWHIQHQQFSEKRAKFYACEVLMALEYFHKNQIVYRDLKLDNILLTLDGHIKLADYGLCKENMSYGSSTSTFCGTPEFMAPEILMEKPYGRAVDWWAFGVLIYEMLLGQSPFRGDDEDEIFEAILEDEILYPVNMAKDAVSLLQKLLTKDPAKRLGGGKSDADEIKKHPFFKGIDWDKLLRLEVTPPYYPTVSGPTDVSNFDEEFTKELPVLTPCHSVLSAADQEEFRGFTHISDWARATRGRAPSVAGK
ncbi:Serine/threonine kinase [Rhizophlyctis rosea]|uniref:protein kinase C n=1 Tax=Rhizophlyctis rosea TaxID=64517 RepID=A0AAD5SJK9_9FUNG|nr:Serine/threonine kinase [Rhizophlyctis rosea]